MRRLFQLLFIYHLIVGVAGLIWGITTISNPTEPLLSMSPEILEDTSFKTFLLPGILILVILGIGSLVSATRLVFNFLPGVVINYRSQGLISILQSMALTYLLYKRYMFTLKIDIFMIVFTAIAVVQLIMALLAAIHIFLFPVRLLRAAIKNSDK